MYLYDMYGISSGHARWPHSTTGGTFHATDPALISYYLRRRRDGIGRTIIGHCEHAPHVSHCACAYLGARNLLNTGAAPYRASGYRACALHTHSENIGCAELLREYDPCQNYQRYESVVSFEKNAMASVDYLRFRSPRRPCWINYEFFG